LAQLRRDYAEFTEREAEVVVVGPEKAPAFRRYWEANDLPFIGLPDPQRKILKLYRQQVRILKLGRMPAQFIIDKEGKFRFAHYASSMADIPGNKEILEILDAL
jgi:peroxiredoxin